MLLFRVILKKLLILQPQDIQLHSQVLNQVPQLFRKQMKQKQERWNEEIKDSQVQASAQIIIQLFLITPVQIASRQDGGCGDHGPETSRPSQDVAQHFQVGCKHCIKHAHLLLSNHIICLRSISRCIYSLISNYLNILKVHLLKALI